MAIARTLHGRAHRPRLVFTKFTVEIELECSDPERVRTTLEDAERECLIANVLKVPVEIIANIHADVRQAV